MAEEKQWVVLTERYGEDIRHPSDRELAQAIDELFSEDSKGMTEGGCAEHPNACLRYGSDDGPVFVVEVNRNKAVTLAKYADQDDIDPLVEATFNMDKGTILSLWRHLAKGEIEETRSAFPQCGW